MKRKRNEVFVLMAGPSQVAGQDCIEGVFHSIRAAKRWSRLQVRILPGVLECLAVRHQDGSHARL